MGRHGLELPKVAPRAEADTCFSKRLNPDRLKRNGANLWTAVSLLPLL